MLGCRDERTAHLFNLRPLRSAAVGQASALNAPGDRPRGRHELGFTADERFTNPAGTIRSGILAAMLDDRHGPPVFFSTAGKIHAPTVDFAVSFLKAPGSVHGPGRVVSIGRIVAFSEAELFDEEANWLPAERSPTA